MIGCAHEKELIERWYSVTRPQVDHFNLPRDNDEIKRKILAENYLSLLAGSGMGQIPLGS